MKTYLNTVVVAICAIFVTIYNLNNLNAATVIVEPVKSGISRTGMFDKEGDQAIAFFTFKVTAIDADVFIDSVKMGVFGPKVNILAEYTMHFDAEYIAPDDVYVIREGFTARMDSAVAFDLSETGFASANLSSIRVRTEMGGFEEVPVNYSSPNIYLQGTIPEPSISILFLGFFTFFALRRR